MSITPDDNPTEAEIVSRSHDDHLYSHAHNDVRLMNIQTRSTNIGDVQVSERIRLSFVYHPESDDLRSYKISKWRLRGQNWTEEESVSFSKFDLAKLLQLNQFIQEIDLQAVDRRRLRLTEDVSFGNDEEFASALRSYAATDNGQQVLRSLVESENLLSGDIMNLSLRKNQLELFEDLLENSAAFENYANDNSLSLTHREKVWQYFFKQNPWIFGHGLDYRFLAILQSERETGYDDTGNSSSDMLMGCGNFTTLVELKRPDTLLFNNTSNRSGAWKLSSELFDAVSQILEQKAAWQVSSHIGQNFSDSGEPITQQTQDPKVVLLVGHTNQFSGTEQTQIIKAKTFELLRRDSRNIEILTYDELLNRAKNIVGSYEEHNN